MGAENPDRARQVGESLRAWCQSQDVVLRVVRAADGPIVLAFEGEAARSLMDSPPPPVLAFREVGTVAEYDAEIGRVGVVK